MSSYSRSDDRRYSSCRDRDHSYRRSSPGPSRHRSPPPPLKARGENELPLEFGRRLDTEAKEDENTVINRMKTAFKTSPLNVVYHCVEANKKIKIWTRNFKEVRGICTGYVLAFDKHWNMILSDVEEIYIKPKKAKTPFLADVKSDNDLPELPHNTPKVKKSSNKAAEAAADETDVEKTETSEETTKKDCEKKMKKLNKKKEQRRKKKRTRIVCKRSIKQLFIRGDNIVMCAVFDVSEPSCDTDD